MAPVAVCQAARRVGRARQLDGRHVGTGEVEVLISLGLELTVSVEMYFVNRGVCPSATVMGRPYTSSRMGFVPSFMAG